MTDLPEDPAAVDDAGDAQAPAVGPRIRAFRTARKMSVRTLAEDAEVSPGFISQLENGRTNAGVATLRRIASALGVTFVDLFSSSTSTSRVLRRAERPLLATRSGTKKHAVTLPPLLGLEVYISELEPGQEVGDATFTHGDSQEIAYVLSGEVTMTVSGTDFTLATGDSIEFRSSETHHTKNLGDAVAEVMWITCPPTVRADNAHGREEAPR